MIEEARTLEALESLGLTDYEARSYVALVKNGTSIARDVSFFGHVPRTKTYGALRSLERKGLIHVVPGKPEAYTAVSPLEVLMPMADKLDSEANHAKATVQSLAEMHELKRNAPQSEVPSEVPELWTLEGRRGFVIERLREMIKAAAKSIDCCATAAGVVRLYKSYADDLTEAKARGVTVRILAQLSSENQSVLDELRRVIEVKIMQPSTGINSLFIDGQSLITIEGTPDDYDIDQAPAKATWTTSQPLATMYTSLFNQAWEANPRLTQQQLRHQTVAAPLRATVR